MPKVTKWSSLGDDEPEDLQDGFYDAAKQGVPPAGTYDGVLKRLTIKENRNKDDMLSYVIEIAEPKGSEKARYNGYGVWGNLNVTTQGAPFIKQFLTGLGLTWQDFIKRTVTESEERPTAVTKIGNQKFESGVPVRFSAKMGKHYETNEPQLVNPRLLKPVEETEEQEDAWDDSDEKPTKASPATSSSSDDDDEPPF